MGWKTPLFDKDGNLTPDDEPMRMEPTAPYPEWRRQWCPRHIPLRVYGGVGGVMDDQGQRHYPAGAAMVSVVPDIAENGCNECERLRALPEDCPTCAAGYYHAPWLPCPRRSAIEGR